MEYGGRHHHRALRSAEAFLLPEEEVVVATNKHWISIAEPVLTCLLAFAIVVWINSAGNSAGADLFWWLWFAVVLRTAWCLIEWRRTWFIITDQRLLKITGIIVRRVAMMPLKKVTDVNYDRTIPGQILRYGRFRFETPGQDQAFERIEPLPHPNEMYRAVVEYVLGGPSGPKAPAASPKPPVTDPTPTRPMSFDLGDRSKSRDHDLYSGGRRGGRSDHGEPDTDAFEIPEDWKRTDDEVAPPPPPHQERRSAATRPARPDQLTGNPVLQPPRPTISGRSAASAANAAGKQMGSWFKRAKAPEVPQPQHHSLDGSHSMIRGTSQDTIGRSSTASGPIIEVKGQRKRRRGTL